MEFTGASLVALNKGTDLQCGFPPGRSATDEGLSVHSALPVSQSPWSFQFKRLFGISPDIRVIHATCVN